MTGHGSGHATLTGATLTIELRAVNHRFCDVQSRLGALAPHAAAVEAIIKRSATRGRVSVACDLTRSAGALTLDAARARDAFSQLASLRDELAPGADLPLSLLSSVPSLFSESAPLDREECERALHEATTAACAELEIMRAKEGVALAEDLKTLLAQVVDTCDALTAHLPTLLEQRSERLKSRVAELVGEHASVVDDRRLELELALLADRADVAEELTRLRSHCAQFADLLTSDSAVGRKLEFLLQEMGRESNTIGSKIQDATITPMVITLKSALERMREQALNVL